MDEQHKIQISAEAYDELKLICEDGIELGMGDLVSWVNDAVTRFFPAADLGDVDSRVSSGFTVRTLRHYQTLGCLSAPSKQGRKAIYGAHQYLQALLIRKYLYLGHSAKQIAEKLLGQDIDSCMMLLCEHIHFSCDTPISPTDANQSVATWQHISIRPGIELHIQQPLAALTTDDVDAMLMKIRETLTSHP